MTTRNFNVKNGLTAGTITLDTATGNATANYFIGNGSALTGITASQITGVTTIANGTTSVSIPVAAGNVIANVGGTANVLVLSTSGANVTGTLTANNLTVAGATSGIVNVAATLGNLGIRSVAATYTDTAVTGTQANAAIHYIAQPTIGGGTNAKTYTNMATLFVANAPAATTNATITNSFAMFVAAGNSFFGGNILGTLANGNSNVRIATANGNVTLTAVGNTTMTITGTGANITGTANISGNANVGNLGTSALVANGNVNVNQTAAQIFTVAATQPPTTDMVVITNTGQNVATAGVSALQINYIGGAGAIEASAYRSDMTPGTTSGSIWNAYRVAATTAAASGVIFNGIKFDNKTAGAGTSRAFYVGTGYDDILNYNGTSVIYGNGVINGAQVGAASSIVNGTSNVNIPASGGNVNTSVGGTANVLVVTATGANITGTLNVTGNATVGNLTTGGGTGGNISGANVISANIFTSTVATGTAPFTLSSNTVVANLNANLLNGATSATAATASTIALRDANANITANFFIGNGSQLTGITVAAGSSIVNGTSNVSIPASGGNVNISVGGTANVVVVTSTAANVLGDVRAIGAGTNGGVPGTVFGNSFTVVGAVYGNSNVSTIGNSFGFRAIASQYVDNVAPAGTVANVAIHAVGTPTILASNAITATNLSTFYIQAAPSTSTNVTATNSFALFVAAGNSFFGGNILGTLANGNSNVRIATANGNVTLTAVGNTTMTITGTGANITGTANVSGNANVGNLGTATAIITTGNITTINSGLMQNGTSNVVVTASGGNVTLGVAGTTRITATSVGANITGTLGVSGNANVGNLGTAQVLATANVTAPQLISNIATGTAPLVVTSTTRVANLNVNYANVADFISVAAGTGNNFLIFANAATGNITELTSTGLIANLSNNSITATTFVGALANGNSNVNIPAANGNINLTAVGNSTMVVTGTGANITGTLGVSGNANAANIGAAIGVFTTSANTPLVQNGTSNVAIASGANVTIGVAGTARITATSAGANVTGTLGVSGAASIASSTAATSRTTGALIVTGGIGANANSFFTNLNVASNIAYVAPNGANTINSTMLNGGTLAWSGNAGQLFSIADSMTGNIFTVNDVSGIPLISVDAGGNIQFAVSGGFVNYGVTTAITAAGSTHGTATTLSRPINVVSTVASGANGIILPTVPAGARILIVNTSANALNVYPPSGAVVNSGATNAAYSQPAAARLEYISTSTTQWYTLNATYG